MSSNAPQDILTSLAINPGNRDVVLPSAEELRALAPKWIRYLVTAPFQDFQTGQNSELDLVLERAAGLGIHVLALINVETINELPPIGNSGGWGDANSGYIGRVADLAQRIARFYRGRIGALEVFNEPGMQEITAAEYAALLAGVYSKVKAVSDVTVISAGLCCGLEHDYLRRVVQIAPDAFDAAGWHPYGLRVDGYPLANWGFGELRDSLIRARAIAGKPLWLTEIGAEINYQWQPGVGAETAVAEYLMRAYALFRELGADVIANAFWFTWKDPFAGWGLVDTRGTRRAAWHAFQQQASGAVVIPPKPPTITQISFSPTKLQAGQLLNVSITVKNNSDALLITQGPPSGFVYEEGENFYARGFPDIHGALRVGIDFDERVGIDHPYRWGLGAPLAPGETRTITGAIRMRDAQSRNYWAGLVQERVAWHQDRQGAQNITVTEPGGKPRIVTVTFSPTTLAANQLLNVSITVKNESSVALPTQGPDPGFVYEEGETFYTRGFPDARGAHRVGIDFEGRSGIDHPYRWGLGAPLAPGETRTITGAIRVKTRQAKNYWAGLVREQIAWLHDQQGAQRITVA
jgi:hypothetical protein